MQNYSNLDNSPITERHFWAVENLRTLSGLGDLSVAARIQLPYGVPDMLFNIYVENEVAKVATRPYPSYMDKTWTTLFEIGEAKAVAMAFDAYWRMYQLKWRMIMDEVPYLFWVNKSNKLYVQLWDDVSTRLELSTDVVKVKAMRGWKNVAYPERDHGLICAYIKTDGKVYYRSYCYQALTEEYTWENEREIEEFTGTATSLNLFITNDYRTGLSIADDLGNVYLMITERNWAGMAIAPEYIKAYPYEINLNLIDLEYPKGYEDIHLKAYPYEIDLGLKFALTDNELLSAENKPNIDNDWGFIIEFKTKYPIETLPLVNIAVTDVVKGLPINMASVVKIDDYNFRLNVDTIVATGINNVLGDIKIEITGVYNEAGYLYDNMDITFTPTDLVPEYVPIPEVDEIWNE